LDYLVGHICNDLTPTVSILFALGPHTPHGFVLPQSIQQWGKRPLHIEGRLFLINTFSCASLGDMEFHEMQDDPFLGHYNIFPFITIVYGPNRS